MKVNYKIRLFTYFFFVFALYATVVVIYQLHREEIFKEKIIEKSLNIYADIIISKKDTSIIPKDLQITYLDSCGRVINQNYKQYRVNNNRLFNRPEVQEATKYGIGKDVRISTLLNKQYYYYAQKTDTGYIRIAMPYRYNTKELIKSENTFIIIVSILFIISIIILWYISKRFSLDLERLKRDVVKQQEAKAALKTEMTSAISHELRTPVSAIRGYTETLCDPDLPESMKLTFIERTHHAAIRLSTLLADISLLSRIEENVSAFNNDRVNINEVLSKVLEEFDKEIASNSISIVVNIPNNLEIKGNNTLIYSILRNLTENAIKYAGKWISIEYALHNSEDEYYHFSVSDSGIGVKEKDLPRLFERFYRADKSGRTREDGGSGLGLAIVRHAVLYHKGDIVASSGERGGLKVDFTILK